MKACCKKPDNWKHDGSRNKTTANLGQLLKINSKNYLTCKVCGNKMDMFVEKHVIDANRKIAVKDRP